MHTMLIVDDEVYIANKIKSCLNWEELGIAEVLIAHNIRQAKDRIENHPVDMIVCDIEMPQGSGIELLEWVRERGRKIEFLFLTCHSEFEYAKRAMQLGSLDYLLKPVQTEELRAAARQAVMKINKEKPVAIERFWLDLIQQKIAPNGGADVPYSPDTRLLPVLFGIHRWGKTLTVREENLLEYALRKAAGELIVPGVKGQIMHVKKGCLLLVLQLDARAVVDQSALHRDCLRYMEACDRYFYCQLSCYVGEPVAVSGMLDMYGILESKHLNNVSAAMRVFGFRDQPGTAGSAPLPQMQIWSEMLKGEDRDKLFQEVAALFDAWRRTEGLDAGSLRQFYQSFLQMFLFTMQQKGVAASQISAEWLTPERALAAQRTVADLEQWVTGILESAFLHLRSQHSSRTIVDTARRYITLHIDQALSRQCIADHVGLSPDYLVKLFKKETGLSISDYIMQERIGISKELLVKSDLPVSSIALAVGYTNFAYFSTVFKKEVSMTPQDYRKACQERKLKSASTGSW